jgi:hypothetical protein
VFKSDFQLNYYNSELHAETPSRRLTYHSGWHTVTGTLKHDSVIQLEVQLEVTVTSISLRVFQVQVFTLKLRPGHPSDSESDSDSRPDSDGLG